VLPKWQPPNLVHLEFLTDFSRFRSHYRRTVLTLRRAHVTRHVEEAVENSGKGCQRLKVPFRQARAHGSKVQFLFWGRGISAIGNRVRVGEGHRSNQAKCKQMPFAQLVAA
jgi:hypothetical protein